MRVGAASRCRSTNALGAVRELHLVSGHGRGSADNVAALTHGLNNALLPLAGRSALPRWGATAWPELAPVVGASRVTVQAPTAACSKLRRVERLVLCLPNDSQCIIAPAALKARIRCPRPLSPAAATVYTRHDCPRCSPQAGVPQGPRGQHAAHSSAARAS